VINNIGCPRNYTNVSTLNGLHVVRGGDCSQLERKPLGYKDYTSFIVAGTKLILSQHLHEHPKLVNIQLGIDNHVTWINDDDVAHTVTPDHRAEDRYSGEFGSIGVVMPGESYEFLFTEDNAIAYHCEPHPWMTGTLEITKQRF